jgi:hypothetical protein
MSGIYPHEDPPTSDDDPQESRRRALDQQRTTGRTGSFVMAAVLALIAFCIWAGRYYGN